MNIFLNKVYNASFIISDHLFQKIDEAELYFNKYEPVVIPKSTRLIEGEIYEAEIFLIAIDTTFEFKVIVNEDTLHSKNGKVIYRKTTDELGIHSLTGKLLTRKSGYEKPVELTFKSDYKVIKK